MTGLFFGTTTKKNLENTDEGKNRPALILINRNRFLPPVQTGHIKKRSMMPVYSVILLSWNQLRAYILKEKVII